MPHSSSAQSLGQRTCLIACLRDLDLSLTLHVDATVVAYDLATSELVVTNQAGDAGDVRSVFDEMQQRDAVEWNVVIGGYARMDCRLLLVALHYCNCFSGVQLFFTPHLLLVPTIHYTLFFVWVHCYLHHLRVNMSCQCF